MQVEVSVIEAIGLVVQAASPMAHYREGTMSNQDCSARARIRAEIEARKTAGKYVSPADTQAAWEQHVERVNRPLIEALGRGIAESPPFNPDRKVKP